MKVMHVPFCFAPDPIGGTEVYVQTLATEQQLRGTDVVIAAPSDVARRYTWSGLSVRRFAVGKAKGLETLYGGDDVVALESFAELLSDESPDLVHLHAFTSAVSVGVLGELRRRRIPTVFTYHTPTASCQRGTLLRWGETVCDGILDASACSACTLNGLGLSRGQSQLLASIPPVVGGKLGRFGLTGGLWTALRMTDLIRRQHTAFRQFMAHLDRIVVLCVWTAALLIRNGVPPEKLVLSRHGLPTAPMPWRRRLRPSGPLRVAFLGRLHPTKGPDTLIGAVLARPDVPLKLDLFGVIQDQTGDAYSNSLRKLAADDPRVRFLEPVPTDQVHRLLAAYDLVAVPSRWLETGPLVVLEAFAAGVPVLGSRLGGIAELVTSDVDGLLVEPDCVDAWSDALARLASEPELLRRLTLGVRPPRTIENVADDMDGVYRQLREPASVLA